MKNWYEILVIDDFIDYFSNESNKFYETVDSDIKYAPMTQKFAEAVLGITYSFARYNVGVDVIENMKEKKPNIYWAYMQCNNLLPDDDTLADYWQSIKFEDGRFRYSVDISTLTANQLGVLILYPFWNRMGSCSADSFIDGGRLKTYLLALKQKVENQ